ncbi:hypothetical protein [Candidatus Nitrosocosmicus sp. SS]|uniref:hypothetical protein n=1 Tax=Candidatus Nitrosocosmicus agrestis TaxID=2563600 RepID=UPI00122DCC3C|nr:hypothetical protein [Candidatus Nitrosocosmicus sp. SS]KAA2283745.1 hypothetical protein F1Z66_00185 [Candidatus Nitrosocosmicus sp. SS]KAF0870121.1 hypothetical protein E5N71_00910 [Candidatus Nitrosocosmicus sp. SS]
MSRKPTNSSQNKEADNNTEDQSVGKRKFIFYKYSKDISLAESILIGGNLPLFLQISNGKAILRDNIDLDRQLILPPDKTEYLSKDYSFSSIDEINFYIKRASKETLDSLFVKTKNIWKKYFDTDKKTLDLCAADTIFTYFQDKLGMTHYLFFVGDNNTGKSNALSVLEQLAYRPLKDVNISPANIYNFLGQEEEGQGIILEDEIDDIEEQPEKMKIYKSGYTRGSKVTRMYDSSASGVNKSKPQKRFNTYSFKAYTSERQPGFYKAKGFVERIFPIQCTAGNPLFDILEVVNDAGDKKYKKLIRELEDLRKLLLIFRVMHYDEPIPDLNLSIKNREKQLCKPLIRLFQDTNVLKDILDSLSKFIADKRNRKLNSLDSFIYSIVKDLAKENNGYRLTNEDIWEIVCTLPGNAIPSKPHSYQTNEFGTVSKTLISRICEDKFGAKREHDGKHRILAFDNIGLKRLEDNYLPIKQIEILNKSKTNTINTINTFWKHIESKSDIQTKNQRTKMDQISLNLKESKQSNLENTNSIPNNFDKKTNEDSDKVLEPLKVLKSALHNSEKERESHYLIYLNSHKRKENSETSQGQAADDYEIPYKKPFFFCVEHPNIKNIHREEIVRHIQLSDLHKKVDGKDFEA